MFSSVRSFRSVGAILATAGAVLGMQSAFAQTLVYGATSSSRYPASIVTPFAAQQAYAYAPAQQQRYESLVPEPAQSAAAVPQHLRRQTVNYPTREAPGTIIVDTPNTYLYYVLGGGKAVRYGIGVGREGFTWSGVRSIERKAEWPDWVPPPEMVQRQPYLPRFMAGGEGNPLGARAMYIGGTIYRIHGTNAPSSIGQNVSSGCIRMLNEDVVDLYERVKIGTKVVVLPAGPRSAPVIAGEQRRQPQLTLTGSRISGVY
jgi:lipoprotein-anchoring transpeptidase ErfK/SrfK